MAVERFIGVDEVLRKALKVTGKEAVGKLTMKEVATTYGQRVLPSAAGEAVEEPIQGTIEDIFRVTQYDSEYDMSLDSFMARRGEEALLAISCRWRDGRIDCIDGSRPKDLRHVPQS